MERFKSHATVGLEKVEKTVEKRFRYLFVNDVHTLFSDIVDTPYLCEGIDDIFDSPSKITKGYFFKECVK